MTPPSRTDRPRRSRGGRPAVLSRERILTAAIAVLDADGPADLTMRAVGQRLGVAAMSLYRYVPGRDALFSAVVDELFGEAVTGLRPRRTWNRTLERLAADYRAMLLAHPRAVPLLATHPVDVTRGREAIAPLVAQFTAAGVAEDDAITAVQSVIVFVLGHALAQVGSPDGGAPAEADPAAGAFYDQWFAAGLHAMLDGFDQRFAAR